MTGPGAERRGRAPRIIPVVELVDVAKSYRVGDHLVSALHSARLRLEPGELVAIAGPSGSGKTTLLNLLAGWEQPDTGQILRPGLPGNSRVPWRHIGVVPQALGLLDELRIDENVRLPQLLAPDQPIALDPHELMAWLGIDHLAARLPDEISLGEQQRTALGRALLGLPALVIADEPTAHQDDRWIEQIVVVLRRVRRLGSSIVLASHDPRLLDAVDRVVRIHAGRMPA